MGADIHLAGLRRKALLGALLVAATFGLTSSASATRINSPADPALAGRVAQARGALRRADLRADFTRRLAVERAPETAPRAALRISKLCSAQDWDDPTWRSEAEQIFLDIQGEITDLSNSFYLLTYTSPITNPQVSEELLEVAIVGNSNTDDSGRIRARFDSEGFGR